MELRPARALVPSMGLLRSRATHAVRHLTAASLYPRCAAVRTYWWDEVPNFGDQLTTEVLRPFGVGCVLAPPNACDLVGIGSLLQTLPADYAGTVWGTGSLTRQVGTLPRATVVAVRGHLTLEALGSPAVSAVGDPALLVASHVRRPPASFDLGIVPNFAHKADPEIRRLATEGSLRVRVIDPLQRPAVVVRQIASCRAVVTSSLHGLIVADAFGIPAAWTLLEPHWNGAEYKFLDHESVAEPSRPRRITIDRGTSATSLARWARPAHTSAISDAVRRLADSVPTMLDVTRHTQTRPWEVAGRIATGR